MTRHDGCIWRGWASDGPRTTTLEHALALVPDSAPRVVFMHDPDSFPAIRDGEAPLAIAAHTHGMQLPGSPGPPDWFYARYISDEGSPAGGWATDYGNPPANHLLHQSWDRFQHIPDANWHAVPEVTVVTLTRPKIAPSDRENPPSWSPTVDAHPESIDPDATAGYD